MTATEQELSRRMLHMKSAAIARHCNNTAVFFWLKIRVSDTLCRTFAEGTSHAYLWPGQTAASRTGASCMTHL